MKNCLIFGKGYIAKSFIDKYKDKLNFIVIDHSLYDIVNPNYNDVEIYIKKQLKENKNIDFIIDSICPILPISEYNYTNNELLFKTLHHVHYINLLAIKLNIKNIIYLSSAGIIYDRKNSDEILKYNHIGTLYGLLKIQSECIYKYFSDIYKNINYKILRISNVWGNIKYHKCNTNGIINIILKNYINDASTNITPNNSIKNYIYVDDLCQIIFNSLDYNFDNSYEIINAGSIYEYSLDDIIKIIKNKYNIKLIYNNNYSYNDKHYHININKILTTFNDIEFNSLENIIENKNINEI